MIPYESLHVMVSPENDKSDQICGLRMDDYLKAYIISFKNLLSLIKVESLVEENNSWNFSVLGRDINFGCK